MTEARIKRKSTLFLNSISPVTNTFDELVKEKFVIGKFPLTFTGILKIIGLLLLIGAFSLFFGHDLCSNVPAWYPYLYPISVGVTFITQIGLFLFFSLGYATKNPWLWVRTDIYSVLALSIITIISSILTHSNCKKSGILHDIPGPLAMTGSVVLIISCGAILILYRYREDDEEFYQPKPIKERDLRKSVHA